MSNSGRPITESSLKVNLNDLAVGVVRELAMACRKVAIYGRAHQLAGKAIERVHTELQTIFNFRTNFLVFVRRDSLIVCNISLKPSAYADQILQCFHTLEVQSVLMDSATTVTHLNHFIESLTLRANLSDSKYNFASDINAKCPTILVNSERADSLIQSRKHYNGALAGDFSVKRFALEQLGTDVIRWAACRATRGQSLEPLAIDFKPEIINYLLPECVAQLPGSVLEEAIEKFQSTQLSNEWPKLTKEELYCSLLALASYHPERAHISQGTRAKDTLIRLHDGAKEPLQSRTIKIELPAKVDALFEAIFSQEVEMPMVAQFNDLFERLLTTAQFSKAEEILSTLMNKLTTTEPQIRQRSLLILVGLIDRLDPLTHTPLISKLTGAIRHTVQNQQETFEYSSLIPAIFERCCKIPHFDTLAELAWIIASRRQSLHKAFVYDSVAIKAAFDQIDQPRNIEPLVRMLPVASNDEANKLRQILVAIGSELVAASLSQYIAHPLRHVRKQVLRILTELGQPSVIVFSRILENNELFIKPQGRFELPDEQWYIVRNSIFVIGALRNPDAVKSLHDLATESDIRVRREVVSALEKIGGQEAIDLLSLLLEDTVPEVREAAAIAIGLIGDKDTAPILIDALKKSPVAAAKVLAALGKLGGPEAKQFLTHTLYDTAECSRLSAGRVSRDEIQAIIIRALAAIGDEDSLSAIKKFRDSTPITKKLFRSSAVTQAISDALQK